MNRSLLVSILLIGVGLTLAGGVTLSLFSDTEQSQDNTFSSGSLDLQIDYEESYNNQSLEQVSLTDDPGAIFNLSDVKPGDSGEATISLHVYDNPGWIWMQLNDTANYENNCTEPEAEIDTTCGNPGKGEGELFQEMNFTVWYDDGDNVFEEDEQRILTSSATPQQEPLQCAPGEEIDVGLTLDRSGSMSGDKLDSAKNGSKVLVDSLNASDQGALISFASSANLDQELTNNKTALKNEIEAMSSGGSTNMADGISTTTEELINGTNARSNASKAIVLLSDGVPDSESSANSSANIAKDKGVRIITIALGSGADQEFMEQLASSEEDALVAPNSTVLEQTFEDVSGRICQPVPQEESSLQEGILLDSNTSSTEPDSYENSTTRYIGFKWELPRETGNIVQTDSTVFGLNFVTQQRRNNPSPENPFN